MGSLSLQYYMLNHNSNVVLVIVGLVCGNTMCCVLKGQEGFFWVMICFVSVYFCTEMKAMSGCEPNHESDTVPILSAVNCVTDRIEIS